jgi:hypothetical protein
MVRLGIPHSLRPMIWMRLSGSQEKKEKSDVSYKDIVKASANDHLMTSKQIEKVWPVQYFPYLFATGQWFSPGTPVSFINITEILLKVTLNTTNQPYLFVWLLSSDRLMHLKKTYNNFMLAIQSYVQK